MEQRAGAAAEIPVADILDMVAATMRQEKGRLNALASFASDSAHGDRMVRAFTDAAHAVYGSGTGDAGEDLQLAGQVLSDPAADYGNAARYLGQGFMAAGAQFYGRQGLTLTDLAPLLAGLQQGAQRDNPAQPGMGTLLDVLGPAAMAADGAAGQNLTPLQTIQGVLGAAMAGVRRTANMPQTFNRHPKGRPDEPTGNVDPGSAGAQTMLTGLIKGLLGDRVPATPAGQSSNNFLLNLLQQGIDLGGAVTSPKPPSGVDTLLGGSEYTARYSRGAADGSNEGVGSRSRF